VTFTEQSQKSEIARWHSERLLFAPESARLPIVKAAGKESSFLKRIGNTLFVGDVIGIGASIHDVRSDCRGVDRLVINSGGGSGEFALAMVEELRGKVSEAVVQTRCCSAAVAILQTAQVRKIQRGAHLMLHEVQSVAIGGRSKLVAAIEGLESVAERYARVIADRTGRPFSIVRGWMGTDDLFFTAEQALAENLVDEIIEPGPAETISLPQEGKESNDLERVLTALRNLGSVRCDKFELFAELRSWLGTVHHTPTPVFVCFSERRNLRTRFTMSGGSMADCSLKPRRKSAFTWTMQRHGLPAFNSMMTAAFARNCRTESPRRKGNDASAHNHRHSREVLSRW
jgi:ATP-dependent protease ClpP protease subunit